MVKPIRGNACLQHAIMMQRTVTLSRDVLSCKINVKFSILQNPSSIISNVLNILMDQFNIFVEHFIRMKWNENHKIKEYQRNISMTLEGV